VSGMFNIDLERDILAKAITDPTYRERARRLLTKHSFTDQDHGWLWQTMSALPAGDVVSEIAMASFISRVGDSDRRDSYQDTFDRLQRREPKSANTSLSLLGDFVRHGTMTGGIEKAIKALKTSDLDGAQAALKRASSEGVSTYDTVDWIEEWDDRLAARAAAASDPSLTRIVPTKLKHLDIWLNGGLRAEQLGLIVGTTGRGKSHFSVHLGFWAAAKGSSVLHISTEMSAMDTATRYDAKLAGLSATTVEASSYTESELDSLKSRVDRVRKRLSSKLRIVATPLRKASIDTIKNAIDDMTAAGRPVDLLIVDCGDHLQPTVSYKDYRLDQSSIYWDLKSLAGELKLPIWSTTQAPKEVVEKIAQSENVADSYDKARIADVIWTLNQSQAEYHASSMRGYLAKNRKGAGRKILTMKVDLSMSHFEDTGPPDAAGGEETPDVTLESDNE
jgi:replicative DNA helicase